ncbi:ABC transporter permease [Solicola gregarius]|uniref:ABC transporter permease n=1 Tax=Solicola gregarius TaxID=2908642 RepID=A0AA46THA9_9ACTN|nr:ABC transporter permease [Solicola gregarius]UYM04817.1 ABC transporter permease [Solicola gregarius]
MALAPTDMPDVTTTVATDIQGRSPAQIAFERLRHDKVAVISAAIVAFFVLVAIFAPWIADLFGVGYRTESGAETLDVTTNYGKVGPPVHGFTWEHPLGVAPNSGYDLLGEWLYGARTSIGVAVLATIFSTIVGVVVGLVAGFATGWLDRAINFVIDTFLAFPFVLGALAIAPLIGARWADDAEKLKVASFVSVVFVLTTFGWMVLARLVRGEVLSLREREFVQAARVIGVPQRKILFREVLPNLTAPIIVAVSLGLPAYVSAEAGLAYLGIGMSGVASWGQTINEASGYFGPYPLYLWAPVIGVLLLVLSLNLLGDAVRDAFDPKTRR